MTGTLKYVTGYTGFSPSARLQEGNYIAFKSVASEGATITAELVGGESGPVTLDSDGICVMRIASLETQTAIKVVATKGGKTETKEFSIAGLTLEEESSAE